MTPSEQFRSTVASPQPLLERSFAVRTYSRDTQPKQEKLTKEQFLELIESGEGLTFTATRRVGT